MTFASISRSSHANELVARFVASVARNARPPLHEADLAARPGFRVVRPARWRREIGEVHVGELALKLSADFRERQVVLQALMSCAAVDALPKRGVRPSLCAVFALDRLQPLRRFLSRRLSGLPRIISTGKTSALRRQG